MASSTQPTTGRKQGKTNKAVRTKTVKRKTASGKTNSQSSREKRLSKQRKPDNMSLESWQRELRRQHGREQDFELANIGTEPFFSEFHVTNPKSNNTYRVAIRGQLPGENFCSCPDFATNALGTCKHIEFTLAKLERKRGGKSAFKRGYEPLHSEIYLQYGDRRQVRFRAGKECPSTLQRLVRKFFDNDGQLQDEGFKTFQKFLPQAAKIEHDLCCYDDALAFIAEHRDAALRRELLDKAYPRGTQSAQLKKLLKVPLYDYQREGALFAARAGRSLIGDEMGLGKTIQALAAAEIMAQQLGVERVLIVCPTSLKHQWEREIEKFTDRSAAVIGGPQHERRRLFEGDAFFKITNYDTVYRDIEFINEAAPDLVILDEAQRIKNWETRTANAVKQIQSRYCVVLTGTPLENRLEELVSIVQFVDRHRLGPTYRFLHDHQLREEETGRIVGYKNLDQIGQTLKPILLRRQKSEVLEQLPERLDKTFFVPMTEQQLAYHKENADSVARIVSKWRKFGFLTEADQRRLMISLQNMRMSCDSTFLLDQETDHGVKPDELRTLLDELLEERDTKAVVFSQWTRMHELTQRRLETANWDHAYLHGGVPSAKRKELIDRFRNDKECRVFLSTDAGGVGLNLQNACAVINLDLPWNPAVLEQRIGRVHRLGQTRPVQVVNFVAQGTIEESMLSVIDFKKSLFAGVLDGGETEVFLGGSRLKKFIETVDQVTTAIPKAQTTDSASQEVNQAPGRPSQDTAQPQPVTAPVDPLSGLMQQGLKFLEELAIAAQPPSADNGNRSGSTIAGSLIQTAHDETTGRPYLRVPMPDPELVERTLAAVRDVLETYRQSR